MQDGKKEQRNISVFFEEDKLARVSGDVVPKAEGVPADVPKEASPKPAAGAAVAPGIKN